MNTSLDDCCPSLTITSTGWSKGFYRYVWGDYGISKTDINGKNSYDHNCADYERFLYWIPGDKRIGAPKSGAWFVSKRIKR